MSRRRGSWGTEVCWLSACALSVACGGAAAPAKSADATSPSGSSALAQAEVAAPPRPLDAMRVHLARPLRDLPIAGGLLAQPPVSDVLANPEQFLWAFVGKSAASVIDLNGPIDGAVGYEEPVAGAVAFRVRAAEAAKLEGRESAGRLRLVPATDVQIGHCELWRRPELRLVCARDGAALDRFGPGLAQLGPPASDASLVVENRGPTYERRIRESLEKADAEAVDENSAERTGRELAQELLRHEQSTGELAITPRGIELVMTIGYTSKRKSPLLQAWLQGGLSPKPLPSPHAGGAFSLAYAGSDVFATLRDAALDDFMADMTETSLATPQDLKDTRAAIEKLLPATGRFALASGADVPAALALLEKPSGTPQQRRKLDRALASWWVLTLEAPPAEYLETVKSALKLNERDIKDKPGKDAKKASSTRSTLSQARAVPKQLPAGSLHLLDTVTPNKDFKPDAEHPVQDAHVNHFFVVPDSARSRIIVAISRNEDVAAAQARAALDSSQPVPAPAGPLLAMRATPAGLRSVAVSFDSATETEAAKGWLQALQALPTKGQQELLMTGEMRRLAGSQDGLELRVSLFLTTAGAVEWVRWFAGMDDKPKK